MGSKKWVGAVLGEGEVRQAASQSAGRQRPRLRHPCQTPLTFTAQHSVTMSIPRPGRKSVSPEGSLLSTQNSPQASRLLHAAHPSLLPTQPRPVRDEVLLAQLGSGLDDRALRGPPAEAWGYSSCLPPGTWIAVGIAPPGAARTCGEGCVQRPRGALLGVPGGASEPVRLTARTFPAAGSAHPRHGDGRRDRRAKILHPRSGLVGNSRAQHLCLMLSRTAPAG